MNASTSAGEMERERRSLYFIAFQLSIMTGCVRGYEGEREYVCVIVRMPSFRRRCARMRSPDYMTRDDHLKMMRMMQDEPVITYTHREVQLREKGTRERAAIVYSRDIPHKERERERERGSATCNIHQDHRLSVTCS